MCARCASWTSIGTCATSSRPGRRATANSCSRADRAHARAAARSPGRRVLDVRHGVGQDANACAARGALRWQPSPSARMLGLARLVAPKGVALAHGVRAGATRCRSTTAASTPSSARARSTLRRAPSWPCGDGARGRRDGCVCWRSRTSSRSPVAARTLDGLREDFLAQPAARRRHYDVPHDQFTRLRHWPDARAGGAAPSARRGRGRVAGLGAAARSRLMQRLPGLRRAARAGRPGSAGRRSAAAPTW